MTKRILYLCEGTSDRGIGRHIERLAAEAGLATIVSTPDFSLLPKKPEPGIVGKLRAAARLGGTYDLVAIHRDADREPPEVRIAEIHAAMAAWHAELPCVPVIPVTMLEAWLLLDERAIRQVAENPNGRVPLELPKPKKVESIADPKQRLKDTLALASELTGRRLQKFQTRFPQNRARLLEMLRVDGPVTEVPSWRSFTDELRRALKSLG
jgi:hypothetical protein